MSKLLDIVSSGVQPGDADFTAAVRRMGAGYQRGTGGVGIQSKTPTGQILAVLRGFHQSNGSGIRGVDLEVGPQRFHLGRIQLDAGLVAAAGAVIDGHGGVFRGGQTSGGTEYRRGRDGAGFGDGQGVAGLGKRGTVSVGEGEVPQNAVGIRDAYLAPAHGDGGGRAGGAAGKAGDFHSVLDAGNDAVVLARKAGDIGHASVVEHIAAGIAVGAFAVEGVGIPQAGDNLVNEKLGGNSGGHIGVVGHGRGFDAVIAVPQLLGVQQGQGDGLSVGAGHGIPDIASSGAAAAGYPQILIHVVAGGAGGIVLARLDTVDGVVLIGRVVISGEVPAQVFNVGRLGSVRAVGLVGHGNLAFQHRCVVGTGLIEQENIGDGRGVSGDAVR